MPFQVLMNDPVVIVHTVVWDLIDFSLRKQIRDNQCLVGCSIA